MRLIDADEIRIKPEYMHDICGCMMIRVEDIARIINDMPSIEPQKWIPCSERLPKVGVNVLVCDIDNDIYLTHMSPYKSFYDEFCDYIKNVVAWMPLPEPYKAESEEA